jgi:phosphopantetheine--protein transferase-like protein
MLVDSPTPLAFNLSDSADWLVCAVTAGTAVGVDIEYCDPEREVMKLARRFFRSTEIAVLEALSREQQLARFYDYWTLKEARVKAHGVALGLELERSGFQLDLSPGEQAGERLMRIAQDPPHDALAHACLLEPITHYRVATCWLRPNDFPPRVQLYELQAAGGVSCHDLSRVLRATSGPINTHRTGIGESC